MSSQYPILDNRPIHLWKVTELKEELKRRKLTTKGLKDDLVKRLDEALRAEASAAEESAAEESAAEASAAEASAAEASAAEASAAEASAAEASAAEASEKGKANGFEGHVDGVQDLQMDAADVEVVQTLEGGSAPPFETVGKENNDVVELTDLKDAVKNPEHVGNDSKNENEDGATIPVDINRSVSDMDEDVEQTGLPVGVDSANLGDEQIVHASTGLPAGVDSAKVGDEQIVHASTLETTMTSTEIVSTEVVFSGPDSYGEEKNNDSSAIKLENEELNVQMNNEDSKPQVDCDRKPAPEDLVPNTSVPENQVSEVSPSLGFQVKSDSISSDCVSINQKNELKDTIITDNVKLEQDIVRPEMVEEPSSRNDVPVNDESHSMDVGGLHEKKAFVEENSINIPSPDQNKTISSDDVGYAEKLNLDRSSGDDSMEEDLPETKQVDSKFNADEKLKVENIEVPIVKEETNTIVVGDGVSTGKSDTLQDISPVAQAEKRKFDEQASVGNNEPAKRQRRWNTETVKGPDLESAAPRPATTPRDEAASLKHNFSRSDSSVSDDAPKERIVPPSQRSPTNSLRIDRFLRPFTLKAVQELLGKTGNVSSFWMDQIKTHCYVTYSSIDEAIETRNAVYNLQWPPNGGRLLVAEFVEPQEVKMKLEAPPTPTATVISAVPPPSQPEPSPRLHREQPPVLATLPPPPPLVKPPPVARERLPSPPPLPEKVDPPIVTLDDLFRKTTATPRIYYLPLSEDQVATKLAAQGKSTRR